jgi:WD40 repeat protein
MLWDLNNGNFIQLLDSIKDYQGSIAISPDGKTLVECCSEFLKVWDLNQRTIVKKMYGYFSHPIFSNNGTILSVNANSTTNYRTSDWSPLYSLNTYAFGNAFSPGDSIQVIVTGAGYQIRMLRVADGSTIRTISDEGKTIFFIAFLPDGKTFLTVSPDGEVKIRSTFALISQWGEVP